jgi:membrane peptidoglycan carboxypeptidase
MPQAPSRYNPYGNNRYSHLNKEFSAEELKKHPIKTLDDLEQYTDYTVGLIGSEVTLVDNTTIYIPGRTDAVLSQLIRYEKITEEERTQAKIELKDLAFNNYKQSIKHPHFVLYIKQILEDKFGKDYVERGGLKVYTTIDPKLQELGEKLAYENGEKYETQISANNIAILSINPKNGEILAMVGSRDYYNEEIDGNVNIVLRPRQPGSSFKPFVYAAAFYNKYAPGTVTYDIPMKLGAARPQNYDGKFLGQISLRRALAQSRNIPAIQAYYLAGEQNKILELVEKMGIESLDKNHSYGYPLSLGAGEVSLM